jgi:hypothetical protein
MDHWDHYDFDFNDVLLANRQVRTVDHQFHRYLGPQWPNWQMNQKGTNGGWF